MKKILIAVLAVATLISFAACDNSNSNTGTGSQLDIAYIEGSVKNAKDYLVGDTPDPADFTFTGYDAADNVVMENMSSALFTADTINSTTDKATFKFNGLISVDAIEVPVDVYTVDKYTLTVGDNVKKTYYTVVATNGDENTNDASYDAYRVVDKAGLTVTATYDGTKTRSITNFTAEINDWSTQDLEAEVSVKVAGTEVDTYSVQLFENAVDSIYFEVAEDYTLWYGADETAADCTLDETKVVLYGKMMNGQEGYEITDATYSLTDVTYGEFDSLAISETDKSVTVYAKYDGEDVNPAKTEALTAKTEPISIEKDYIEDISVSTGTGVTLTIGTDYSADADTPEESIDQLTVSYVMASGETNNTQIKLNAETDGYTITPDTFEGSARKNVPVTVTVEKDGKTFSKTVYVTLEKTE